MGRDAALDMREVSIYTSGDTNVFSSCDKLDWDIVIFNRRYSFLVGDQFLVARGRENHELSLLRASVT